MKKLFKLDIHDYVDYMRDKQAKSAIVLNTREFIDIFEDLEEIGLLKKTYSEVLEVKQNATKFLDLTRPSSIIISSGQDIFICPFDPSTDIDSTLSFLNKMPDRDNCFVKYDDSPSRLIGIHNESLAIKKVSPIVEYIADNRPDFTALDIKHKLVKFITKFYKRAVEDFTDKLYWTIIGSYTNMLGSRNKGSDEVENLISEYVFLENNNEHELLKQLMAKIQSHEELILNDLICGDKDLVYICQPSVSGHYSILKYNIDFRIVCYERFIRELEEEQECDI